jgi:Rps23 Pro-64 3,4-dihydroxylase Tpa1-like proline 4-hydroxylase
MSEHESVFIKKIRQTMLQTIASILLIVTTAAVPFYFNTQSQLKRHEELIQSKADKQIYELTNTQIREHLIEIKQAVKELNQKQNNGRIYQSISKNDRQ